MKTLMLLRHAKSSWKDDSVTDHDRPLNKRGRKAAPLVGHLLRDQHLVPDLITSSSAVRAQTTATVAAEPILHYIYVTLRFIEINHSSLLASHRIQTK